MTKVFIGMPVFNGASFIHFAINSAVNQTFGDWKLLISDNCSTDETEEICRSFAIRDPRIGYFRQKTNYGPVKNFKFLLDRADSEYFMWLACDDVLHQDFLATAVRILDKNPDIGFSFATIENIDTYGKVIREYPNLSSLSGPPNWRTMSRYLLMPYIEGKANLFYSLGRSSLFKIVWEASKPEERIWAADTVFVAAALCRAGLYVDRRVLFQKRHCGPDGVHGYDKPISTCDAFGGYPAMRPFLDHCTAMVRALRGTGLFPLGCVLMGGRLVEAAIALLRLSATWRLRKLLFRSDSKGH